MNKDKRASLSSGLLGLKDAAPATEDGTFSAGTAALSDTAQAESRATLLYSKGAASASGFRPNQWSFDGPSAPQSEPVATPEPARLVMPFPIKAPPPAASPLPPVAAPTRGALTKKPVLVAFAVVAVSCISLGGIALVAMPHRASDTPVAVPHHASEAPVATATQPRASEAPVAALPVAPAPTVAAPVPDAVSAGEVAELMARADQLVATGDIVAARGFYERAAEQGNAPAMTAVGKTYDPVFLEEIRVRGSRGDAVKAAEWYRRAGAAGDAAAAERLKRLIARYAG